MSGYNLTQVVGEELTSPTPPHAGQPWNQYAESFFFKQRAEWFVPFICRSPWTFHRLMELREVTEALKISLTPKAEYKDLLLSEGEKAQFFHQLQAPLTVYDSFITLLNYLIDSVNAHPIVAWLVEQRIIFSCVEKLIFIIGQLEKIEQAWAKLISAISKETKLKKEAKLVVGLILWSARVLNDIRELKAYLSALHMALSDKPPHQQEAI